MFKVYNDKGFVVQFANGYEVSTMFGVGNYASNRDQLARILNPRGITTGTAEIVVFKTGTNEAVSNDVLKVDAPAMSSDGVTFGWSSAEVFAAICAAVAVLPNAWPEAEQRCSCGSTVYFNEGDRETHCFVEDCGSLVRR